MDGTAILSGARLAHGERTAHEQLAVEALDGFLGRGPFGVFDERESARAAGFPVEGADNLSRLTDLRKVCAEVVFGGLIRQVADEQSD